MSVSKVRRNHFYIPEGPRLGEGLGLGPAFYNINLAIRVLPTMVLIPPAAPPANNPKRG